MRIYALIAGLAILAGGLNAAAAELPAGATILDPDIVWDVANPHSFAISPDGKLIAYISKGALWSCPVDSGPPAKLADLPNTITAILAEPENQKQREEAAASPHDSRYNSFTGPVHLDKHYVFSLTWTSNQDGVNYTLRMRVAKDSPVAVYHVMHASLAGVVEEITSIEGHFGVPDEYETSFHVTADRKFVIASAYVPLIWDVVAARPRATLYDYLLPSPTSGRFLGIEIDTRQLVLVDEQFQIAKRFDVTFPSGREVVMVWSADERFVLCRTRDEYGSFDATALRIDLATGRQTPLGKCGIRDTFVFLEKSGVILHLRVGAVGVWGYINGELGTYMAVRPAESGVRNRFFRTKRVRLPEKGQKGTIYPPMIAAPDGSHVAVAVPRPDDQPPGVHYHLVDRDGHARPFAPVTAAQYSTPYFPIAFAEGGDRLIARSGSTLFSLPASVVAVSEEANGD